MGDQKGERIKVIFRSLQIHDSKDLDGEGEFVFTARVKVRKDGGEQVHETRLPPDEKEYYSIMENQAWNRLTLDVTLFEGEVEDHMEVEILGEELDLLKSNDKLERYHRVFSGPSAQWIGHYRPGDEGSSDPERMADWWVFLEIASA